MDLPSRAMQTPRSRVMSNVSKCDWGLEWVRALYRAPESESGIIPCMDPKPSPLRPGTPYPDSGDGVHSSGARIGAVGSLVLPAQERLDSRNESGVLRSQAGVVPLEQEDLQQSSRWDR